MDERPTPRTPREALLMIIAELGEPGAPDIPDICIEIAKEGLKPTALETFDENDRLKEYLATAHTTLEMVEGQIDALPTDVANAVRSTRVLPPDIEAAVEMRRHRGA